MGNQFVLRAGILVSCYSTLRLENIVASPTCVRTCVAIYQAAQVWPHLVSGDWGEFDRATCGAQGLQVLVEPCLGFLYHKIGLGQIRFPERSLPP